MRINNLKVKGTIISVYFILIVLAILFATVFSAFSDLTSNPFLTFLIVFVVFIAVFLAVHTIAKFFEYDSDGIKVVVVNRGLLLSDSFNYREYQIEFYKENLISYKFKDFLIYKTLTIYYKDSSGHNQKGVFNVTTLSRKKRKYIRQSLSKMIKYNKKLK